MSAEVPFKRGDVVVYVESTKPEWRGTLAIVRAYYPNDEYPVQIEQYISRAPGFPHIGYIYPGPWIAEAWEVIGHIELPTIDVDNKGL